MEAFSIAGTPGATLSAQAPDWNGGPVSVKLEPLTFGPHTVAELTITDDDTGEAISAELTAGDLANLARWLRDARREL